MPTKPASLARRAIFEISAGACRAALGPIGFRRSAPNYWRLVDGLSQCVNFQASAWGAQEAGRFTINLGISSPALYEGFIGRKFPKVPAAALWPVSARIGFVMQEPRDPLVGSGQWHRHRQAWAPSRRHPPELCSSVVREPSHPQGTDRRL